MRDRLMREYIFRGKRVDNSEWVEGYYIYDESGQTTEEPAAYIYHLNTHPCGWDLIPYEVFPESVGQYTGLTDKKGKKIFEGDIVLFSWGDDENRQPFYIEYSDGGFLATPKEITQDIWSIRIGNYTSEFEVIGNIHDNPELLKGGE